MAEIARRRVNLGRALFVVHRQEINAQANAAFERATGLYIGTVMAEKDEYDQAIVCASIQTLAVPGRMARVINAGPIATLFIDECHHYTSKSTYATLVREVRQMYPDALILGVSATPFRQDKEDLTDVFTPVFARSIGRMQDEEWLSPTEWKPIYIPDMDLDEIKSRIQEGERDFSREELSKAMLPHAKLMAESSYKVIGNRSTLIFAVSIPHMWALTQAYSDLGMHVKAIYGEMPKGERERILRDWKDGLIQGVVNVGVLTEGFDNPGIECLVMARPTQSPGLYTQMLGRGLRTQEGKPNCLVIDFSGRPDINAEIIHITLPDIMGVIKDPESTPEVNSYKLRMFKGWSPVALTSIPGTDVLLVSAESTAFGIALNSVTGLWDVIQVIGESDVLVLSKRGYSWGKAADMLTIALERAGVAKTLWRAKSSWHSGKPSMGQVNYLRRLSPSLYEKAFENGWNKAQYANGITMMIYGPVIRRWRKRQKASAN
jgi:hypothetical protein